MQTLSSVKNNIARVGDSLSDLSDTAQLQARRAQRATLGYVRDEPVKALAIAAVLGLAAGFLAGKSR
ncbi:hypothetical protein [Niveibacterium sp. SC-1]|uniref:glycine zipper domain-containing protein n=1 Tax=Niveibacterium sp. SC-1 TaxID=3135646 RepID=UPI00311E17EC